MKTTTIRQSVRLPAPPAAVYAALTDSKRHAAFTGASARMSRRIGGRMSAYGGYISGKTLGLFPGRGLVQTWRTTEWPEGCADSRLEIHLAPAGAGTRLTMIHSNVPASQAKDYARGWRDYYWKPLRAYPLATRRSKVQPATLPAGKRPRSRGARREHTS